GVGQFPGGGGIGGRIVRHFFKRDYRPTALVFAYLAAIFRKLGHKVEYSLDDVPSGADLYVFNPSLITLPLELQAMAAAIAKNPGCKVIVTGAVAHSMTEAFDGLPVTVVRGEAEQLLWKLDDVLNTTERSINIGKVDDLDKL